jgi:hypothetical protein
VLEIYAFEMLTGRRLVPLPISTASWSIANNADDSIKCSIKADSIDAEKLDVWGTSTLARNGLLAVADGTPVAHGPIWKRNYKQGESIELTAGGIRSYWNRRLALPVDARDNPLVDDDGVPVTAYDIALSGLSLGTIAKRYVELVTLWPGGNIPMVLPADELGTHERYVKAIELKKLRGLIDDLTNVERGPDINFRARWAPDGLGIYTEMETGTEAVPRLGKTDPTLVSWVVGAPMGGAYDLEVNEDGTDLAEEVFAAGGRSSDRVVIARGRDTSLYDNGYPLLQAADTSHSDVDDPAVMQAYADRGAEIGKYASSFWKLKVRAHEAGSPPLGDYWLGDLVTLTVDPGEPVLGNRDGTSYDVVRRVAAIGGNETNEAYDITFAEAIA